MPVLLASLLLFAACSSDVKEPDLDGGEEANLLVTADLSGTMVTTVVIEVTAADITAWLVLNIAIEE